MYLTSHIFESKCSIQIQYETQIIAERSVEVGNLTLSSCTEIMTAVTMPGLSHVLQQGPPRGNVPKGLDKLRYNVLTHGIPSNVDGMVRSLRLDPMCCGS